MIGLVLAQGTIRQKNNEKTKFFRFNIFTIIFTIKRALHYSVAVKRELSKKKQCSQFWKWSLFLLTYCTRYGSENSVMTERVRSQVQQYKMSFLKKIKRVILLTRCKSFEILKSLQPLLLQIERSQLKWFDHVS